MDCTYTDFTQLYTTPFSLTSLFAVRQKWQNGVLFRRDSPRKSTGLIYLHRCNGRYTAADGTAFDAQPGSVVCLPAGSCYSVYNHDCAEEQDDAFLVEFNLHNAGKLLTFSDAPFLLDGSYVHRVAALLCEATNAFEAAVRSPVAVYAAVYTILSVLGKAAHGEENRRFRGILPAVRQLEQNDGASVEELAAGFGGSSGNISGKARWNTARSCASPARRICLKTAMRRWNTSRKRSAMKAPPIFAAFSRKTVT